MFNPFPSPSLEIPPPPPDVSLFLKLWKHSNPPIHTESQGPITWELNNYKHLFKGQTKTILKIPHLYEAIFKQARNEGLERESVKSQQ